MLLLKGGTECMLRIGGSKVMEFWKQIVDGHVYTGESCIT